MSSSCDILAWLKTIPPAPSPRATRKDSVSEPRIKRVKTSHESSLSISRLPTPPLLSDMESLNKNKRQRTNGDTEADDDGDGFSGNNIFPSEFVDLNTPKARLQYGQLYQSLETRSSSLASRSRSRHSSNSRTSSPTKQQRNAALQSTGYEVLSFVRFPDWQPNSLEQVKDELRRISCGEEILPIGLRGRLFGKTGFTKSVFFDDTGPALTSTRQYRYPDVEFVEDLLERAAVCLDENEGEASWNMDVHNPLLAWAFRQNNRRGRLVDYRYCPAAQIVSAFKPQGASSQHIDFCVHIRPEVLSDEQLAIDAVCIDRPNGTINHVDSGNLSKNPIVISIETKKHGEGFTKAVNQMATWHSAQWRSLCFGRCGGKALSRIEFLPGIIVQGHTWMFVATVRRNERPILFHQMPLGDTETMMGIFKLLLSLQYLRDWAENTYWPAFKADILGMED
ncbi:hypothetical protein FOVG_19391 [Fusarium oxysporum f. sp. pisi HDV247]|uniref:PD-(D/E)XK nuclease-like domain-containing protein n=1 Tax=Fusarium oxysporum f. sp. pisi HDV247 TaxID=1080344 RepID=W9N8W4_FUSOX|nr:hypothetical protein FOVG_19391 [Fusarium oxysporum f. sp. pisi HDV247]EXA29074.1 hypothetical protein FOVG_19391 [Fusarium oxysporum f. sp. pisi HDV247]